MEAEATTRTDRSPAQCPGGSRQLLPAVQAALASRYAAVPAKLCRFPHTMELLDGRLVTGEADLRGFEEAFLGGELFWGRRVVEIAPVSGWLSSYIAARAGDYVALELAEGDDGGAGWEELRRGWWFVMRELGLEAAVVDADRDDMPPADIGSFDTGILVGALSRCPDPLLTLRRAAELTDDVLIVTEPVNPETEKALDEVGSPAMTLLREPRHAGGPRWALSVGLIERLLDRLGFLNRVVRYLEPRRLGQAGGYVTVVARRPTARATRPPDSAADRSESVSPAIGAPAQTEPPMVAPPPLPLPDAVERSRSAGTEDPAVYLALGAAALTAMLNALRRAGVDPSGLHHVLDFGCGYGRVLRHWHGMKGVEPHGTDTNVAAILWNRERLGYGTFAMNTLDAKLALPDGKFDFVYAIGVFNHLPETMQLAWARELLRVLRPGGYCYFTTFAASRVALLSPDLQRAMDSGMFVATGLENAGTDECAAFHSPDWVVRELQMPAGAALVEYVPSGLGHPPQDCWLWKKPE